mmetsp:Transcript_32106/g.87965  ORF Transcript_32106/g.87965 Transcript_32106/m.87965 type:complete len:549 (+) Transcript_32106:245-1891(+)
MRWVASERYVRMLLPRTRHLLALEELEVLADALARQLRRDDLVDKAALRRHHRVGKLALVLGRLRLDVFAAEDDLDGSLGAHHGHLSRRPCVVEVAAQVLGGHHVIRAAVSLARDYGDFGHRGLCEGKEQLGAVPDDAAVLLRSARQEAGHVDKRKERDVEAIAEADEARRLHGRVDIEAPGEFLRLVGDDPDRLAVHPAERGDDVLGVTWRHLEDLSVVDHAPHERRHVVRRVRVVRHDQVERIVGARRRVLGLTLGRRFPVRRRHETDQLPYRLHRLHVVLAGEVRHARRARVRARAAEGLRRHGLIRHRLDHLGARHKHVGGVLDHHGEVGHRGRVHRAARARPHDHAELRHDARRDDVPLEDLRVAGEGRDALLDARASGVVEADDGRADLECLIHDFADLFGVRLAQRAAEHREVLREDEDAPPVDLAVARHDTVSRRLIVLHTEVDAAVGLEHVVLAECPWVKQQLQPLARRQLSLAVLRFNPTGSASEERRLLVLLERGGYRLGLLDEDGRRRGAQDSHAQVRTQQRRRPATPADDGTQHI